MDVGLIGLILGVLYLGCYAFGKDEKYLTLAHIWIVGSIIINTLK